MKEEGVRLVFTGLVLAVVAVASRGCNNLWNNRTLKTNSSITHSFATGINGHVEFTKYRKGGCDAKVYHSLGHTYLDSELLEDFDGDGKVDRIRSNRGDFLYNRQSELLVRTDDFEEYRHRFEESDAYMAELRSLYGDKYE